MLAQGSWWPKIAALFTWVALLTVAFGFGPTSDPQTGTLVKKMLVFNTDGVNPSLFALFNLMGVMPMVCACLLAFDSKAQRVSKWPFVIASFALGAFALLPYFIVRTWGLEPRNKEGLVLRFFGSKILALVLSALALIFGYQFFWGGGLTEYFGQIFPNSQFAFAMTFDFGALSIAVILLMIERARTVAGPVLASIPIVGPAVALAFLRSSYAAGSGSE